MLNRWQHQGSFGETFIRALASAADWSYPMRVAHFNELAGTDYSLPRFLVVVIVPKEHHEYAIAQPDQLVLNHAAYWVGLQD